MTLTASGNMPPLPLEAADFERSHFKVGHKLSQADVTFGPAELEITEVMPADCRKAKSLKLPCVAVLGAGLGSLPCGK